MAKKRSMTTNKNHHKKRIRTWYNGGTAPWSDLNHHILYIIMMQLGVVDFIAFSGVCKSWRSLALSNRIMFMASRPPMFIRISPRAYKDSCYLIDFEGGKFRTILPHLVGRTCVGLTCGYLILFGSETHDLWLVNPITRHEVHFPNVPFEVCSASQIRFRAILVFSPSMSRWVFVMLYRFGIWISMGGKGVWNYVSSIFPTVDLQFFKGKIYTLNYCVSIKYLFELILGPKPKLILLKTKNVSERYSPYDLASSGENLYWLEPDSEDSYNADTYNVHELDLDDMKWVLREKSRDEYAFFLSDIENGAAVKQELWADPCSQYGRFVDYERIGKGRLYKANMWYFPHDCLNVNRIDE